MKTSCTDRESYCEGTRDSGAGGRGSSWALGWVNRGWGIGQIHVRQGTAPPSFRAVTREAGALPWTFPAEPPSLLPDTSQPFHLSEPLFPHLQDGYSSQHFFFSRGRSVVVGSGQAPQSNSIGLILALPLTDCVTWGFHSHLSVPQFPHL